LDYLDLLDDTGLAQFTKEVQRWIYEKQFIPKEKCKSRRFFIYPKNDHDGAGLGAKMHRKYTFYCLFFLIFILIPFCIKPNLIQTKLN